MKFLILVFSIQFAPMHRANTFKFLSKRNKKLKTQDFHWAGFLNDAAAKANPNGLWHFAALIPTTSINYVPKTQQTTSQQTTPRKHTPVHTRATPPGWLVTSRAGRRPQVWSSTGQKLPSSGQEIYAHTLTYTLARPIVSHFVLNYTLNRIAVAITCGPLFLQPFGQHALSLQSPCSTHFNPIAARQLVRLCVWSTHWALDRFLRFFNQVICAKHLGERAAECGGVGRAVRCGAGRLLNGLSSPSHK